MEQEYHFDKKAYNKEYSIKNKDKLNTKIQCEDCGEYYMKRFKSVHIKTKKHIKGKEINELRKKIEKIKIMI